MQENKKEDLDKTLELEPVVEEKKEEQVAEVQAAPVAETPVQEAAPVVEEPAPAPAEPAPVEEVKEEPKVEETTTEEVKIITENDDEPEIEMLEGSAIIPEPEEEIPETLDSNEIIIEEPDKAKSDAPAPEAPKEIPIVEAQSEGAVIDDTMVSQNVPKEIKKELEKEEAPKEEKKETTKKEEKKKSGDNSNLIKIIIVGVILIGGALAFNFFMNPSTSSNSGSSDTPAPEPANNNNTPTVDKGEMELLVKSVFSFDSTGVITIYPDNKTYGKYNTYFSSLFTDQEVSFSSLVKEEDKLELAHAVLNPSDIGNVDKEALKKTYDTLFGENSFKEDDYKVDGTIDCKIDDATYHCTGMKGVPTNTDNRLYIKYVDVESKDGNVEARVYAVFYKNNEYKSHNQVLDVKDLKDTEIFDGKYESLNNTLYTIVFEKNGNGYKLSTVKPVTE